jgi:hypothetical protein
MAVISVGKRLHNDGKRKKPRGYTKNPILFARRAKKKKMKKKTASFEAVF